MGKRARERNRKLVALVDWYLALEGGEGQLEPWSVGAPSTWATIHELDDVEDPPDEYLQADVAVGCQGA